MRFYRNGDKCPVCFRRTIRAVYDNIYPDEVWCSHCYCQFLQEDVGWYMDERTLRIARAYHWLVAWWRHPLLHWYYKRRNKSDQPDDQWIADWKDRNAYE